MARVFYECWDWPQPAGGIRRLYRHVEILRAHEIEAYILHHQREFIVEWFTSSAPIRYLSDQPSFLLSDIIVIPEGHVQFMKESMGYPCRRIAIALNWARVFQELSLGETWQDFGIREAIAGSRYEGYFLERSMNMPSTVIPSGIDLELFHPKAKIMQIACVPLKNRADLQLIINIFHGRFPEYSSIDFVMLEGTTHQRVAQVLSVSAVFLAHTHPEGLSRKTLEAMASGCIVVGFDGLGSGECMHDGVNCYRVADGDFLMVAERLGEALQACLNGSASHMQANAVATARRYSLQAEEHSVVAYWRNVLSCETA